jgi:hypothetical protein
MQMDAGEQIGETRCRYEQRQRDIPLQPTNEDADQHTAYGYAACQPVHALPVRRSSINNANHSAVSATEPNAQATTY